MRIYNLQSWLSSEIADRTIQRFELGKLAEIDELQLMRWSAPFWFL